MGKHKKKVLFSDDGIVYLSRSVEKMDNECHHKKYLNESRSWTIHSFELLSVSK